MLAAVWGEVVATDAGIKDLGGSQLEKGCTLGRFHALGLFPLLSLIIKETIHERHRLSSASVSTKGEGPPGAQCKASVTQFRVLPPPHSASPQ